MRKKAFLLAAVLLCALAVSAPGGVTIGGDPGEVTPANPSGWTTNTLSLVGLNAERTGWVTIDGGSILQSEVCRLGVAPGASGLVTVTGAGSAWNCIDRWWSGEIDLGVGGTGALQIVNGGTVNSAMTVVGEMAGSAGSALVSGPGSVWNNSGYLYLGYGGSGTLTVADGGLVNAETLLGSLGDLSGNGTISATGVVLDADLAFDATHDSHITRFGTGGLLNISNGTLGVGYRGTGTLRIADGVTVNSSSGYLGYNAGSTGTGTVSGLGTIWTLTDSLSVGSGALTIQHGARVNSNSGGVGGPGSTGTATITGLGSCWANTYNLTVGSSGSGTLSIQDGGQVSSNYGVVGVDGGTATVTIAGAGSTWANVVSLTVGASGSGSLFVQDGGHLSSNGGCLGDQAGSTGTVTVSGVRSIWTNTGDLYVGKSGAGKLAVSDGGAVTARSLWASLSDLSGNGRITVARGAVLDGDVAFDAVHGSAPTIPFGTGGSLNLTVNSSGPLGAGYRGTGNLRIADGVAVACNIGYVGYNEGSTGTATVSGSGSRWTTMDSPYVGWYGSGTLNVEAGGRVSGIWGFLGRYAGSTGTATVTGTDSTWTSTETLYVGLFGKGTLNVEAGGQVNSGVGRIGSPDVSTASSSIGTATITGLGSKWTNAGNLYVGEFGSGTLNIQAGGQVSSVDGYLGGTTGPADTVTVTGLGSEWNNSGSLYIKGNGLGLLTVGNGGLVTARMLYASLGQIAGNGTITASKGAVLDADLIFDAKHGLTQKLPFGTGGSLNLTVTSDGVLGTGYRGTGTLRIAEGQVVTSNTGYVGYEAGSTGTATVTGAGSIWTNLGSGIGLTVSYGTLIVADGGKVTATALSVNRDGAIQLNVSGDGMIVLGNAASGGALFNGGKVNMYANAFLPAGTYTPVTEYSGKGWFCGGGYYGFGGLWSNTTCTFSVSAPTALPAGKSDPVIAGERLLFTDAASSKRAGASFGTVGGGVTFSAAPATTAELAGLSLTGGDYILSAWDFTTNLTGSTALLAMEVGLGKFNVKAWRFDGTAWSAYTAGDLIYDSHGVASFNASAFGPYAITASAASGDANCDGKVDDNDLNVLLSNWNTGTDWRSGNFKATGTVDDNDLNLLLSNWTGSGAAAPEPVTMALLALGGLATARRRHGV